MRDDFTTRVLVAERLEVTVRTLDRYERAGLVRSCLRGRERGYRAVEVRRLWTAVSLERDLGVNLAGVEVILHMRDRMHAMMGQMAELARWAEQVIGAPQRQASRTRGRKL